METAILGFRAYDIHELACHFVARHAGLYRHHGLQVRIADITFSRESELPPRMFHAACGAALTAWLSGSNVRVVFVAAERPMFWLHARSDVQELADLDGKAVAGFPTGTPPALFLRSILQREALDPERVFVEPARDDIARMGLLCDSAVSAALVSSAIPPQLLTANGFRELLCFGEELHVPTTGLAVAAAMLTTEPDLVATMCLCYEEAIRLIHDEPGVLEAALVKCVTANGAEQATMAQRVRRFYTRDGRVDGATLDDAIAVMVDAMALEDAPSASSLYDFSRLS